MCMFDDIRQNPGNLNTTYTEAHSVKDQRTICAWIMWLVCQCVILLHIYYDLLGYLEKKTQWGWEVLI